MFMFAQARRCLKSEEFGPEGLRYAKLNEALTRVLAAGERLGEKVVWATSPMDSALS
jgi:hypothetical protein